MEEAVSYLFTLSDDEDATGIDIALEPPEEGVESDVDDLDNDTVMVDENINLLGYRILSMPAHISLTNRDGSREVISDSNICQSEPSCSRDEPPRNKSKIELVNQ